MPKETRSFHQKLVLENFTAFGNAELNFVPGVNAIIGENGTGKTHILKALYAAHLVWKRSNLPECIQILFQLENSIADLIRSKNGDLKNASVEGVYGSVPWSYGIQRTQAEPTFAIGARPPLDVRTPVFIPAIDMMGHTRSFVQTFDNYKIDFDLTHREIVSLLLSPEQREYTRESKVLIAELTKCLDGTVELKGERFYLVNENFSLPMPSVAEGLRKIATLVRLAQTGWLAPGSTLFWDEPEVNLNPILMDEVVGAILALSRSGVQVFLATHSYVILKELEVQSLKSDSLRFFALEASVTGSIIHQASKYLDLHPNKIEQQYSELYDRRIEKAMGATVEG